MSWQILPWRQSRGKCTDGDETWSLLLSLFLCVFFLEGCWSVFRRSRFFPQSCQAPSRLKTSVPTPSHMSAADKRPKPISPLTLQPVASSQNNHPMFVQAEYNSLRLWLLLGNDSMKGVKCSDLYSSNLRMNVIKETSLLLQSDVQTHKTYNQHETL